MGGWARGLRLLASEVPSSKVRKSGKGQRSRPRRAPTSNMAEVSAERSFQAPAALALAVLPYPNVANNQQGFCHSGYG